MPWSLDALRDECQRISTVVLALGAADFARPTRLPSWSVKEVLAHLYMVVQRTSLSLAELPPPAADADAITYWSYERATDAPATAEAARTLAASYEGGHELALAWDATWRRAVEAASLEDGPRPVVTWGPVLTLDDFLRTRVLELVVHGIDLARALDRPPWATRGGMLITLAILTALLGIGPPSALRWNDVAFVEKGTGRIPLTRGEREILGGLADRFPLLA